MTVLYREAQAAGRHRRRRLRRRYAVTQRLFHRRQRRSQRCFVHLIGQGAIPGDADKGGNIPPQMVHGPGDRIRHLGLIHAELVVLTLRIIMETWLVLEAVEAQELYWFAVDGAIGGQRWPIMDRCGTRTPAAVEPRADTK